MTGCGVPAGREHAEPGAEVVAGIARARRSSERRAGRGSACGVVTAIARSLPSRIWPVTVGIAAKSAVDVTAEQIGHHRAAALVGDVQHVDAGEHLQELAGEVVDGAGARRRERDRLGLRFRQRDELAEVLGGHRRMDDEHVRIARDERNRRQVLQRVERHLAAVQRRVGREVVRLQDQRVAVRRRARDGFGRDQRVAARTVLDHDLLAHALRHLRGDDAREDVRSAAGRERHEHLDRLVRIVLRARRARQTQRRDDCDQRQRDDGGRFTRTSPRIAASTRCQATAGCSGAPFSMMRYR